MGGPRCQEEVAGFSVCLQKKTLSLSKKVRDQMGLTTSLYRRLQRQLNKFDRLELGAPERPAAARTAVATNEHRLLAWHLRCRRKSGLGRQPPRLGPFAGLLQTYLRLHPDNHSVFCTNDDRRQLEAMACIVTAAYICRGQRQRLGKEATRQSLTGLSNLKRAQHRLSREIQDKMEDFALL